MQDALIKAYLSRVEHTGLNSGCNQWSGLVQFSVLPNGSYPGIVPFENMPVGHGEYVQPDILVYDGTGGFHGANNPVTNLNIQVSISGVDATGNPLFGTGMLVPPTDYDQASIVPHPPAEEWRVEVNVDLPPPPTPGGQVNVLPRPGQAKLLFYFTVATMC